MEHKLMTYYLARIRENARIAEEEAKNNNVQASIYRLTDALENFAELIDQINRPAPPPYR